MIMLAICLSALLGSSILEAGNDSKTGSPGGATGGEVYWATDSYRPIGGSWSAWPAGGVP